MGVPPFRVLSVCTGGAGLDRGLRRAEPTARTVCYVEIEAFACAVLAAQMDAGALDQAPIWTDARTFDGRTWRGAVDCVVAGFPCQDISSAGKRAGIHGERSGVWFDVARIVRDVGARYVFLENVDALLVRGIDTVLGSLAEMGFTAAWGVFSAAEVGAPHLRERVFILGVADAASGGQRELRQPSRSTGQPDGSRQAMGNAIRESVRGQSRGHRRATSAGESQARERERLRIDAGAASECTLGNSDSTGLGGRLAPAGERAHSAESWRWLEGSDHTLADPDTGRWGSSVRHVLARREQPDSAGCSEPLGESNGSRLAGWPRERSRGTSAQTSPVLADPDEDGRPLERRGGVLGRNECHADGRERPSAIMGEFPPDRADMRAWAAVQAGFEPAVCRLADGLDVGLRTDWLRLLGNGVVPQQAEHAYRTLRAQLIAHSALAVDGAVA